MDKKVFISNENIGKYAKVQGTSAMADRGKVVLLWDELDREGKKLARDHIEIDDIEVVTSEPYKVPDKWNDNIRKEGEELEATDIIKQVIANPSRSDVFELLMKQEPPEPLMLWWLNVCFSDPDYFKLLSEVCHEGLFKTDPRYLWGVMAFGIEHGEGKFYWPESTDEEPEVKQELTEKLDVPEKELDLAWPHVHQFADELMQAETRNDDDDNGNNGSGRPGGLL